MAAKSKHNTQSAQVVEPVQNQAVENVDLKMVASELVLAFEKEIEDAKHRVRGQSLPYRDIIDAIDMLMDVSNIEKAPIGLLAGKVEKLLVAKYKAMGDGTFLVTVKTGATIKQVPNNELRVLRQAQLAHMMDSKTKDNMYRRVYGLGFRKEFKRFELVDGMLHRIAKPTKVEETPTN